MVCAAISLAGISVWQLGQGFISFGSLSRFIISSSSSSLLIISFFSASRSSFSMSLYLCCDGLVLPSPPNPRELAILIFIIYWLELAAVLGFFPDGPNFLYCDE